MPGKAARSFLGAIAARMGAMRRAKRQTARSLEFLVCEDRALPGDPTGLLSLAPLTLASALESFLVSNDSVGGIWARETTRDTLTDTSAFLAESGGSVFATRGYDSLVPQSQRTESFHAVIGIPAPRAEGFAATLDSSDFFLSANNPAKARRVFDTSALFASGWNLPLMASGADHLHDAAGGDRHGAPPSNQNAIASDHLGSALENETSVAGRSASSRDQAFIPSRKGGGIGPLVPGMPRVEIIAYKPLGGQLSEAEEQDPGWFINVNWDDDDGDGWTNGGAPPDAAYTPDKDDVIVGPADDDLWRFDLDISDHSLPGGVRLTYPEAVKAYSDQVKENAVPSGTIFPVANLPQTLYLEGLSGSGAFRDVELKAEYVGEGAADPDIVKVTVFEVGLTGFFGFGDQQEDNTARHSNRIPGSSDKNGRISWDDANADGAKGDLDPQCEYFGNAMETQGTVTPPKPVAEPYPVAFDFVREVWGRAWEKHIAENWILVRDLTGMWHDDEQGVNEDEDLTVSGGGQNHIYDIDEPGYSDKLRTDFDYGAQILDFREIVNVNLYGVWFQTSDYFTWHSQLYLVPKNATELTRDSMDMQKLGPGWIAIPENP